MTAMKTSTLMIARRTIMVLARCCSWWMIFLAGSNEPGVLMLALRGLDRNATASVMMPRAGTPVPANLPRSDLAGLGKLRGVA